MASVISNYIDGLSSTQLYTAIVGATVALCVVLLGPDGNDNLPQPTTSTSTSTVMRQSLNSKQQPKWYLFKYINVGVFLMFIASVAIFLWDASTYIHNGDRMTQFLVAWSLFLCYFFGFFGVFFIHQDLLMNQADDEVDDVDKKKDVDVGMPKEV